MKQCVVCRVATVEQQHETVTADVCPERHGLWLLERELLRALRTHGGDLPVGTSYAAGRSLTLAADRDIRLDDAERSCPMCEQPMGSVEFGFTSGVTVDVCAQHGVWLDDGELEQLEAAADRKADSTTPHGVVEAARVEAVHNAELRTERYRLSLIDVLRGMLTGR